MAITETNIYFVPFEKGHNLPISHFLGCCET